MRRATIAIGLAMGLAAPAAAQESLGTYFAYIGPNDFFNSRGVRLRDACAVIQQDRANYHRFGKRDDQDQGDPWFDSPEARAVIGNNCRVVPAERYVERAIENGEIKYIRVTVLGRNGRPTGVIYGEGAG